MAESMVVHFSLNKQHFGIAVSDVERVLEAVDITPLPGAPDGVLGIVNVHGSLLPVYDIRARLKLPHKQLAVRDQFVICRAGSRKVALLADSVQGVVKYPAETMVTGNSIISGLEHIQGAVKLRDDVIFVQDLSRFLSLEEDKQLQNALNKQIS